LKTIFFTLFFIIVNCNLIFGQADSLLIKSYEYLENQFYENEYDFREKARSYADAYLKKGKLENDTIQIARGYKLISYLFIDSEEIPSILKYCDSIINITKNSKHRSYPAYGYYQKGVWLFEQGNYKEALDNYLIAKKYATERNNKNQLNNIKLVIAALKDRYGEYEESIILYNQYLDYIMNIDNFKEDHPQIYLAGIYNVANGYLRLRKLDSADVYINRGLEESKILNDTSSYYDFLSSLGTTLYFKKDYEKAINILNEAIPHRKNYGLAICYFNKAECLKNLGEIDKSIIFFKKSDSIYQETKYVFPGLRKVYESLIDDAKSKDNIQDQLLYIERLLETDSILDSDFEYISKNIIRKYDTTLLLDEKQLIINRLDKKTRKASYIISILIIISLVLVLGSLYIIRYREKLYKKRFNKLINESKSNKNSKEEKSVSNEIANDVTTIILQKLQKFEKEKKYIEQGLTLNKVADLLQTNSSYLSKVVNVNMKKTFNTYINDLRIEYVIERLKKDKQFRKYTIASISEEVGYANSQSFANAFYKKTGIKPSYFIKQLGAS